MTPATPSMMESVSGLEDVLNAVRENAGSMLEGSSAGYNPVTPNNVQQTMVMLEENQAFQ